MTPRSAPLAALLVGLLAAVATAADDFPADIVLRRSIGGAEGVAQGTTVPAQGAPSAETPATLRTLREEQRLNPLLGLSFSALDEDFSSSGNLVLPLPTGSLLLEGERYPLVSLTSGRTLIVDMEGRIDAAEGRLIEELWKGYKVVTPPGGGGLKDLLSALFVESGFHSVTSGTAVALGVGSPIRITPDFFILKTPESILDGYLYLVNLRNAVDYPLPAQVIDLAEDHRIRVVQIDTASGKVDASSPRGPGPWAPQRKYTASDLPLLLREIAPLFDAEGAAARSHGAAPAPAPTPGGSPTVISRGERSIEISPVPGGVEICSSGAGGVRGCLDAGGGAGEALAEALRGLGVSFFGPTVEFYRSGQGFTVTVPGVYLPRGGRPLLLTFEKLDSRVTSLLRDGGVDVVSLAVGGGAD